jgi:hypothetical protein
MFPWGINRALQSRLDSNYQVSKGVTQSFMCLLCNNNQQGRLRSLQPVI